MLLATLAICAIVCYQAYWLTDIYDTLTSNLQRDIQEAMRASDFEEITHRVAVLKEENIGGKMQVKVGVDEEHEKGVVGNNYKDSHEIKNEAEEGEKMDKEMDSELAYDDFANVLRSEKEVMNVGLHMQRGIHSGLDALKPSNVQYYDSVLTRRLDSLGVQGRHRTRHLAYAKTIGEGEAKTLYINKGTHFAQADTFHLALNIEENQEYELLVEKSLLALPRQMYSPILFSIFTLLILIVAFWYIISMLKKTWALDEMKSDFTNNITHELKTPIAVAYAANDALLNFDGKSNPEKLKKYLTICQDQLSVLSELVEQILSLSMERRKSMHLEMEDVEVAQVVEKIVSNHKLKTKKPLTIDVQLADNMTVHADRMHFSNIINNLVDNAIKYSSDEIHITITGEVLEDGKKIITVKDQGIGISHDQQQYIFDRFYRVPHGNLHNIKGYGLGLYYVKNMMKRFNGTISLNSALGKGSTFKLEFNG